MDWTLIGALAIVALAVGFGFARPHARRIAARWMESGLNIIDHPSPNVSERNAGAKPSILVLHYTAMASAKEALDRLCDPAAQVSSHYLVGADGTVWRLVDESKKAWHAGISFWRGARDLNQTSIGIEIDNSGTVPFPAVQMDAVQKLCRAIIMRHGIKAQNVIGHSDIAPGRKPDPGWLFDWKGLASNGIGVVPAPSKQDYATSANWDNDDARAAMSKYGWTADVAFSVAMEAFQRHFHQEVAGTANVGKLTPETAARLAWLARNKA